LHGGVAELFNAHFHYYEDPYAAVEKICEVIHGGRVACKIDKVVERKLYDMKDRREL